MKDNDSPSLFLSLSLFQVVHSNDPDGTNLSISEQLYDHEAQKYTAKLTEALEVGKRYVLSMDFEGYLNDKLKGFYRSSYTDEDMKTR